MILFCTGRSYSKIHKFQSIVSLKAKCFIILYMHVRIILGPWKAQLMGGGGGGKGPGLKRK